MNTKTLILIFTLFALNCLAEPKLHPLFTDHMVLQRDKAVPVYGSADPGEKVTVEFAGQKKIAMVDEAGEWKVYLDPMPANTKSRELIVSSSVKVSDVLVGDVWVCSGQSNMQTKMGFYPTLLEQTMEMTNSLIRLFKLKENGVGSPEPSREIVIDPAFSKSWQVNCPLYAKEFSTVAMLFAQKLQPEIGVPIGLISANRGGTFAHSWMPIETLKARPEYAVYLSKANPAWQPSDKNPGAIKAPAYLYNGTIYPLIQFVIKGVIWYQGEADSRNPERYTMQMEDLISSWRKAWGDDFYFLYVQLPSYGGASWDRTGEAWAWLREAQAKALKIKNADMAVILDAGEYQDIHPQNKVPVGQRLALLAEKIEKPAVVAYGPVYESVRFEKNTAIVSFKKGTAAGLQALRVAMNTSPKLPPGQDSQAHVATEGQLGGFTICGSDRNFITAEARIDGDSVVVSHPSVAQPVAVRYGWANFSLANLYNNEGLPAAPFRTDGFDQPEFEGRISGIPFDSSQKASLGSVIRIIPEMRQSSNKLVVMDGVECWQSQSAGSPTRYMYFKVTDSEYSQVESSRVKLSIVYLDKENIDIRVRYDSSDKDVKTNPSEPGAWKDANIIKLKNSGNWRVAIIELADAFFRHRCNGGDVRLEVSGDIDFFVQGVYAEKISSGN